MPKTNEKENRDKKNLLTLFNFIFLKVFLTVVVSNIHDAFGTNHFTQQINIISSI